jgi:putative drug exporter of the RND superfamily
MSTQQPPLNTERPPRPFIPRAIRGLSIFVILGWIAFTLLVTFAVPRLEVVGAQHSVPLAPQDAPAVQAMQRMGRVFKESNSDSFAMLVLEGQQPLGDEAHAYYDRLIRQLRTDTKHVEHVQDLWSDRLTAAGAQSPDGKAAYVQLNLAGNQGTTLGQDSVASVRNIIAHNPPPPGISAYVTGPSALLSDMQSAGDGSILKITMIGALIIFLVLLVVYRSVITVILLLITVAVEVFAARGIVAFLGDNNLVGLSTFATNLLIALAMAAGTDYGIFFFGRYQEARQAGEDRESAFYTTYRSVAPVVLGSGLTIAGAMLCLSFTRMPIFQTVGVPCAVGMFASVVIALSLAPAVIALGSGFGLLDPRRTITVRGWRRVGTAIVRWPGPILAASCAIALVGIATLPGYKTSYNDRAYLPNNIPANLGYSAADRHFSQSRMMPEIVMVEANHDMRNPTDFLVLHRLAKSIFKVPGISRVVGITRPEGTPIEHTSIPFMLSMQNSGQSQDMKYMRLRADDMLKQADMMKQSIAMIENMYALTKRLNATIHDMVGKEHELNDMLDDVNSSISDFADFFRPLQSYFYWEKHCYDIPVCWSIRGIFDTFDGVDDLDEKLHELSKNLDKLDALLPGLLASFPPIIENMHETLQFMMTNHSTMTGMLDEMDQGQKDASAVGQAFDQAKDDDSFWLPPEIFQNPDFKRAMTSFFSPDGKAVRFIISHRGDPASVEAINRIDQIRTAAEEALKTTPLEDAKIYIAGNASTFKDFQDGSTYDLLIAGVGSLCLIFIIMIIITRSFIAALVIVGTVALSLGSSFGLSVLVWQYLLGFRLHWMVIAMSVIILLAVGSDYNLLLVSRMKDEIAAGIKTGIIRAMGSTGKVVTNAGLVFAFTMMAMVVSDLTIIGQVGTTIGLGLLFDTLVVRSFMTPSIAALLGRWFWWPQKVRPRPASSMLRPSGPRPLVRSLLLPAERIDDDAATAEIPRASI